jgi:hypothetical protein
VSVNKSSATPSELSYIHHALPDPPVYADGHLCILFDADGGGVDRLSRLLDSLLRDIVSRLPSRTSRARWCSPAAGAPSGTLPRS